jgi:hypothetical protein
MTLKQFSDINLQGNRIIGLPASSGNGEPVVHEQLESLTSGLSWKNAVRVATQANINTLNPGVSIDGVTLAVNDRVLVRAQTNASENGIYLFAGAASAMVRAPDANTANDLEQATVTVEEGTSEGTTHRQTAINFVLETDDVIFNLFGSSAGPASENSAGIAEIATLTEVNAAIDDSRIVTPAKLAASSFVVQEYSSVFGDGSATQFDVSHNLNNSACLAQVQEVSTGLIVGLDITILNANTIRLNLTPAPDLNSLKIVVLAKK